MIKQIVFISVVVIAFGILSISLYNIFSLFKLTKPFPIKNINKRISLVLKVAFGQSKIFRRPIIGFLHALVFWGFCMILFGSLEMMIDGIFGLNKSLSFLGIIYTFLIACGDVFALLVLVSIIVFLFRRIFLHLKRFGGIEMQSNSHADEPSGFVTILDKNFKVVSNLAGNDPTYSGSIPEEMHQTVKAFQYPHDVCIDDDQNMYVAQWNSGHVYPYKLEPVV